MTAELDRFGSRPMPGTPGPAVTVLAPLAGPEQRSDLERPEAATIEVFDAVTRVCGPAAHQLVPVRRRAQPGPYTSSARRSVEMLDATTLEDVAAALGQNVSRVVHAVGWEAGVVAAALSSSHGDDIRVVLEPLGAPGSPEWTLAEHASIMLVQSESHQREALHHGVPRAVVRVVPLAAPACPGPVAWSDLGDGARLVAVLGDGVDLTVLEAVEALLRDDMTVHVVFAGAAGRLVRERTLAVAARRWPAAVQARLHLGSRVSWQLLARVDAVLDVCGPTTTPRGTLAAMAAGRAVVAVARRPAAELVEHGTSGVLVPVVDRTRCPAAVSELVGSPSSLRAMGDAARERWQLDHSPTVRAARLAAVYDGLVG